MNTFEGEVMKRKLQIDVLEDRKLPAVTTAVITDPQLSARVLQIQGTASSESIGVSPGRTVTGMQFTPSGLRPVYENGVWVAVPGQATIFYADGLFNLIRVNAGGGNDRVGNSSARSSFLFGEAGNDTLTGGSGDDVIFGGTENDTAVGGLGSDRLFGEAGDDKLFGDIQQETEDLVPAAGGHDLLWGGAGNDQLFGGSGDDFLFGGDPTVLSNDPRRDLVTIDSTFDDQSSDQMSGQQGNDFLNGGGGFDICDGGSGFDTAKKRLATLYFNVELKLM